MLFVALSQSVNNKSADAPLDFAPEHEQGTCWHQLLNSYTQKEERSTGKLPSNHRGARNDNFAE